MAAITTAVIAGAAIVGAGVSVAGAINQRKQAKQAQFLANETAEENRIRRDAAIAQREEVLGTERVFTEIERQREIRQRINQARAAQAQQEAAAFSLGIRAGISAVGTQFAGEVGFGQAQFARETALTTLEREQQDILTGLTPISELSTAPRTPAVTQAPLATFRGTQQVAGGRPPALPNTTIPRTGAGRSQGGRA